MPRPVNIIFYPSTFAYKASWWGFPSRTMRSLPLVASRRGDGDQLRLDRTTQPLSIVAIDFLGNDVRSEDVAGMPDLDDPSHHSGQGGLSGDSDPGSRIPGLAVPGADSVRPGPHLLSYVLSSPKSVAYLIVFACHGFRVIP